ncbi:DUF4276 family protein [Desulfovibrio sp. ZJ369]|uniref:DUF4276 family protein n=1 Tax=Desulfovibrio sp. ZJ369 TaxID=2709793 RepID=UPI0013EB9500|nr:DUF4276 family protein [Desulfovibrio sp. ZJ369]
MKIHVVAEGRLEIPVACRLIAFCGHQRGTVYELRGSGNIKKKAVTYARLANAETAVLILTDLMDSGSPCALAARSRYFGRRAAGIPPNVLLRFAVKELESWLLADHENFSKLLGIRAGKISSQPDVLPDPKKYIAKLASLSPQKAIKADLISASGRQGRLYIPKMEEFINESWDIKAAMRRSPSLKRCINRLRELHPVLP